VAAERLDRPSLAKMALGELRQLIGGGARRRQVPRGEHDLDVRGEEARAAQVVLRLVDDAADRRLRVPDAALGQP